MWALPSWLEARLARSGDDLSIAVIRLGAMGDIVRVLPAVRLLRFHLPDARIEWVCDDRWSVLVRDHRDIDRVIEIPRARWRVGSRRPVRWPVTVMELVRFRRSLRWKNFDLTLDFHGNLRSGLVAAATGAPVRLGHDAHQQKEGNRLFSTHRIDPGPERRRSRIERHLALIRSIGVHDEVVPDAGFRPTREEVSAAREIARAAGAGADRRYAVLNPGASASQAYKQPPAALLAAAAREIHRRGWVCLVVHGPGELAQAELVAAAAGGAATVAAPTTLKQLIPLIRGAGMFVGGDSGPLHLACGVGCPVVGLYGPTDPVVNAPWRVPHRVVVPPGRVYTGVKRLDRRAGGFIGMREGQVVQAVSSLLGEIQPAHRP